MARVVLLAGGTGGAKLARGLLDVVGDDLTVVVNTGDDLEVHGAHVCPDPDLVTFWLADRIDERGWGLRDDTFHVMDTLRELGDDVWFNLGDRDLAISLRRARRLAEGATLTDALGELCAALGVGARVLPMSDAPVRTAVLVGERWLPFQEFMIQRAGAGPVDGVQLRGLEAAQPSDAVLDAIAAADAIIVGPSNPVVSIGPILAVPGMKAAVLGAHAPVVGVSPIVNGAVLKGPTAAFLAWAGRPATSAGVLAHYGTLLDAFACDERLEGAPVPVLVTDMAMPDAASRTRLAREVLSFAEAIA